VCNEFTDQCELLSLADATPCNADDNGCTVGDACLAGDCVPGEVPDCSATGDQCNDGVCESLAHFAYACTTQPKEEGIPCDDGLFCTEAESCNVDGVCTGGQEKSCSEGNNPCIHSLCVESSQSCKPAPAPDGTTCDDDDPCTLEDGCVNGVCIGAGEACDERKLNLFTQHKTFHAQEEIVRSASLGGGRVVTVWRAGPTELRAQMVDSELSKVKPEFDLTVDWPPVPNEWASSITLGRPTVAATADGNWLVAVSYKWRHLRPMNCKYTNDWCEKRIYYVFSYTVLDREGNVLKDWTQIGDTALLFSHDDGYYSCNCNLYGFPDYTTAGSDWPLPVAFSDGTFAIFNAMIADFDYDYHRLDQDFQVLAPVEVGPHNLPETCITANDKVALVYGDALGTVRVRYLTSEGVPAGDPVEVSETAVGHQERPFCRAFPDGKLAVTFNSCALGGPCDAHVQLLKANGSAFGTALTLNQPGDGFHHPSGSPVVFADGSFGAVWSEEFGDSYEWAAKGRTYGSDLQPLADEMRLHQSVVLKQYSPQAVDMGDQWYAVWAERTADTLHDIYFRKFNMSVEALPGAPERKAPGFVGGHQQRGGAAGLPDGRLAVAWESEGADGDLHGISLRIMTADGTPEGSEVVVNQVALDEQREPALAYGPEAERLLIAWTATSQAQEDIHARLFDQSGLPATDELAVNTTTPDNQRDPGVAPLDDGRFVVTWTGYANPISGDDVYARIFEADGAPASAQLVLNKNLMADQRGAAPAAVGGDSPGFVVAWTQGGDPGLYVRIFNLNGTPVTQEEVLIDSFGDPEQAAVDVHENAGIVACWRASGRVLCQRLDMALNPVGAQIDFGTDGDPTRPAVRFRDSDRFWVVFDREGIDADCRGVYRMERAPEGNQNLAPVLMNLTESGCQIEPFLAPLSEDRMVVGWTSDGQDGSGNGIYYRLLD